MPRALGALLVLGLVLPTAGSGLYAGGPSLPGTVTLRACTTDAGEPAVCGTFAVPENRAVPGGRTLALHLLVLRAARGPAREAVFVFGGGPGQAATRLIAPVLNNLAAIRETRDVVFLDQRGTGRSHPLNCDLIDPAAPASAFGAVFAPAAVERCRRELSAIADLTQYTTAAAVADVEAVRAALGYSRVLLFGGSYGTRAAQAYMKAHPAHVGAAVLDGVVPMDDGPRSYARSLQDAVDAVFAACAARPPCQASYPELAREFTVLLDRLRAGPVPAVVRQPGGGTVDVQMRLGDFAYAVRGILYTVPGREELPALIHEAARSGRLDVFAERYWQRARTFRDTFSHGLHFSVLCAEDIAFVTDADMNDVAAGTFLGRYLFEEYRAACASWPRAIISAEAREPVRVSVPTLLLSGEFDPVTPPAFAARVAASLSESRHIIVPGGAHGSFGSCARPAMLHVLATGTLAGVPSVCQ